MLFKIYIKDLFQFQCIGNDSEIIDKLLEMNGKKCNIGFACSFPNRGFSSEVYKHNPLMNENDANLINAIDFINETKEKEDENAKPQPTEIHYHWKTFLVTRYLLGAGIVALTAALVRTLIYI